MRVAVPSKRARRVGRGNIGPSFSRPWGRCPAGSASPCEAPASPCEPKRREVATRCDRSCPGYRLLERLAVLTPRPRVTPGNRTAGALGYYCHLESVDRHGHNLFAAGHTHCPQQMSSLANHLFRGRDIYDASPVWLQHAAATAFGLAWKWQRYGGSFEQATQAATARERFSPEQWREYQTSQLRHLLAHAHATVPYYRDAFDRVGVTPHDCAHFQYEHISRLPFLEKETVRRNPLALISSAAHPRRLHRTQTSGTTATPLTVSLSLESQRTLTAVWEARGRRWAGVHHGMSRAMFGGRRVVPLAQSPPPFWRFNWAERQIYLSAWHVSPENACHYVGALDRFNPDYLVGYGSSYFLLAQIMRQQNLKLTRRPLALLTSGDMLTAEMRTTLEAVYGCPVFDSYGSAEACCLASECEFHRMHVSPDVGVIEVVGADGRPVADGEAGEIVATGLLNRAQPLMRYRIGDWGRLVHDACPCGRRMPVLEELGGRLQDTLVTPDGRLIRRAEGLVLGVDTVREGQIVQEQVDGFCVRVVTDGSFGEDERAVIYARCRERLGDVNVRFEIVDRIERTSGGKFRSVISNIRTTSEDMAEDARAV